MFSLLVHLFLGMIVSFAGSLPPGVISITVMDTAVRRSFRASLVVAATASIVEFFQSFVAILFSRIFMKNEMVSVFIQKGAAPVFLVLGLFFLTKDRLFPKKEKAGSHAATSVVKGLMVGALNVFVIPFWIFWSTYFASNKWISLEYGAIALFSLGVTVGTFGALFMYAKIGIQMSNKTAVLAFWGNKTLGIVFIALGLYQVVKLMR